MNVGELFKVLNNNDNFINYCSTGQTVEEIINKAITDEELMSILTLLVNDISVIKSKMSIVIGQIKKKTEKNTKQIQELEELEEQCEDFKHKPLNPENTVWFNYKENKFFEVINEKRRLVVGHFEWYY